MEFAKDNASYLNNANPSTSESTTVNHSTNCEVPCFNKISEHTAESRINALNSVSVIAEMAPSTDEKNILVTSDKPPAPDAKEKNKHGRKEKPKDVVTFRTHLTSLAHISVLVFVYTVIKLAFRGEFVFFTWHPILMSFGWMLLMTEGFYSINKYNTYWRFKTKGGFRVKIHVISIAIGYTLSIAGFVIVYINKNLDNKQHFVSWHGLFGLIGIISTFPPVLNGIALWYKKELAHIITKPRLVKFVHVLSGCLAYFFGALSLVLSVYTRWFAKKSNKSEYIFYIALLSVVYPLFWAIYGPAVKLATVIKEYFSEEKEE